MGIPENARIFGVVHRAAVNQDQQIVGVLAVEAAGADGPFAGVDLRHIKAGNHAQQVGDVERAGAAYVLRGDDEDGRGGRGGLLLLLGHRGHLDVHQVFEALLGQEGGGKTGENKQGDPRQYQDPLGDSR